MKYPNFIEEKKLWQQGYDSVAGVDEAGRGPLAGPVVAACVIFNSPILNLKIKDSKKMTEKQREQAYDFLTSNENIKWGVGVVSEKTIDRINILQATKLAMRKSLKNLNPEFLLIDGNFGFDSIVRQKAIVAGDQKVFSIAAAGIIAKVTRDRIMQKYHRKYPDYGFGVHKGYGTKAHFVAIKKFGACPIHRKSFYPIKQA